MAIAGSIAWPRVYLRKGYLENHECGPLSLLLFPRDFLSFANKKKAIPLYEQNCSLSLYKRTKARLISSAAYINNGQDASHFSGHRSLCCFLLIC